MKFGAPVLIAQEEPGRGPSFERHVLAADWFNAAQLLELDDCLPRAAMDDDQAVAVAKYLAPRSLRLELEGADWLVVPSTQVTVRKPGQQAPRLAAGAFRAVRS